MSKPGTSLYVNADWSALVPAGSPEAAFGLTVEDAKRRGLLPLADGEHFAVPDLLRSANLIEPPKEPAAEAEPEAKEAEKPADKAAPKPTNKSVKKLPSK